MPRIARTILPRIRKSIEERGLWGSLQRSFLLPAHLIREYRDSRDIQTTQVSSRPFSDGFDREHGVDTDGDFQGWTYLSDLKIPSENWIRGNNYAPIEAARFRAALSSLRIRFEDFVFVDFGSGKGRALLLASEFPFRRIVGVEFSPELHAIAEHNMRLYQSGQNHVGPSDVPRAECVCADFLQFPLPQEPSVYFLFDPCDEHVLGRLLTRIGSSLQSHPRQIHIVYIAPTPSKEGLLDGCQFLTQVLRNAEHNFCVYTSRS